MLHVVELLPGYFVEVSSSGEEVWCEPMGIFIRASLPWVCGVPEVHFPIGGHGELLLLDHFFALVPREQSA